MPENELSLVEELIKEDIQDEVAFNYDSEKIRYGFNGEAVSKGLVCSNFLVRNGYKVKANNFKEYTRSVRQGVDMRLFYRNRELAHIEVKNWNKLDRPRKALDLRMQLKD